VRPGTGDPGHAAMTSPSLPFVDTLERAIWGASPDTLPRWQATLLRVTRFILVLARDLMSGELTLRSMSLVYTTLLSIVPLLALSFSVLKAFGVHNQVEPALRQFLAPLGPQSQEVTDYIIQFVARMNVGVLGSVGFALLLYTAVSLVQKMEESFNYIWHIAEPRSMGERFSRYLSVLLVGPILVFSAIGMTAAVTNLDAVQGVLAVEPLGWLLYRVGELLPYLLVIGAFIFIYIFVPNTRVRFWPALTGGLVGGLLWQTGGWAFAKFVAASTRYSAIYSSFAILVLFMIWLYVSWLILLFGAAVAFYRQHPEYILAQAGEPRLSNRMRERLALAVMALIADSYSKGLPGWPLQRLARELHVPSHAVRMMLAALEQGEVLVRSHADPPAYLPARDLGRISVAALLRTVRCAGEDRYLNPAAIPVPVSVEDALGRLEHCLDSSLEELSVANLAAAAPAPPAADSIDQQTRP
jgi:membrane protein